MKNVAWLIGIFLIFIWIISCVSMNKNVNFVKQLLKFYQNIYGGPQKLRQQPLQEVHNHHNNVKNNFYIKNRERLLENVDDENNVSTAEEILTDYNERMEPKRKRTIMAII